MADHLVVQASGAVFSTIDPPGWAHVFGVFVTAQDATPVPGFKKPNFSVWELTTIQEISVVLVTDMNADFPSAHMPGVYRVQTSSVLGPQSPAPQEFVFAIRVSTNRGKMPVQGVTTVPITYLRNAK